MRKQWIPKPADPLQDQINALLALKLPPKPTRQDRIDRQIELVEQVTL